MKTRKIICVSMLVVVHTAAAMDDHQQLRFGTNAYGSWHDDAPGVKRKFSVVDQKPAKTGTDLEKADSSYAARVSARPMDAKPKVPEGFSVELFAQDLKQPRVLRTAPNGDVFLAETGSGRILVYKADSKGTIDGSHAYEFATGLEKPFGIAFYPAGNSPQYVFVGEPDKVERFTYKRGDTKATANPVTVLSGIPKEHHWTRDLAVADDGKIFLSVGSGSNAAGGMPDKTTTEAAAYDVAHGLGAAWGKEEDRAAVWTFDKDGKNKQVFAHGLRNCTGLGLQPEGGALWCVVNERDALGDDVPFEYATTVKQGAFYGWPWYYIGNHHDPRRPGQRPDLENRVTIPDVLIQPHSAPLSIAFYQGSQFPAEYRGDAFITLHGSWNRANRTGYKVIRMRMQDGKPTGEYIDFMTGFVSDDEHVWGRPVGVTVGRDGSLLVSEDGNGTVWRITATR